MIEKYEMVRDGHWHQIEKTGPGPVYSNDYMSYYNRIGSDKMSILRYVQINDHIDTQVHRICDVGYEIGRAHV